MTNATLTSIQVLPQNPTAPTGAQVTFTANGTFSDQSVIDLTSQVVWSTSDATVATVSGAGYVSVAGTSGQTAVVTATFTQNVNGTPVTTSGTSTLTVQ